ncbi:MAG: hypothetical protein M9952_08690 [Microthrixaceae bacterium]|nr:hypothetical protein [Microthrixaceae bacterium]MCO5312995.1 hypothetical protein [Microthrixaceae bacterium]
MPWCDDCDHFYTPSTLNAQGQCPNGHQVVDPSESEPNEKLPWHFWLLVIALVLYLGWRAIQGIEWLLG